MSEGILGIHHVTAICSDAKQNFEFYTQVLGMRLVKKTVNFDDPTAYHLYYGDSVGHPGTLLTFFAYPGGRKGTSGKGQTTAICFGVPSGSLGYWESRLAAGGVATFIQTRFGNPVLIFEDPDGMQVELTESDSIRETRPWINSPVPAEAAILGIDSVTLTLEGYESTAKLIHERMGYRTGDHEGSRFRYHKPQANVGAALDLVCMPDAQLGRVAIGSIHHIAFRVESDQKLRLWRVQLVAEHVNVSPVMDRSYFHSIYFREPGGVLFEIATDVPGFATDEDMSVLGQSLALPAQHEPLRAMIESKLPPL